VLHVEDLGTVSYEEARRKQLECLEARVRGEVPDTLFLLEHPPVVTLGRGTDPVNLLDDDRFPVIASERGGDVTLHAPGQVVGYLIRLLTEEHRDLHAHMRLLEEIVIRTLLGFGIESERLKGKTGVWTHGRKIASLGVACRNWCTWHGFALNVGIDLEMFRAINPCGFDPGVMTSMEHELESSVPISDAKQALERTASDLLEPVD